MGQQLTYSLEPSRVGIAGQLGDTRDAMIRGYRNDLASSAEAPYGRAYSLSTASDGLGFGLCVANRQFLGVLSRHMDSEATVTGMANGQVGNIIREGSVWVSVTEAVGLNQPVKVNVAGANQGQFSVTASTGNTATLANARFLTSTAAAGVALVELNSQSVLLTAD